MKKIIRMIVCIITLIRPCVYGYFQNQGPFIIIHFPFEDACINTQFPILQATVKKTNGLFSHAPLIIEIDKDTVSEIVTDEYGNVVWSVPDLLYEGDHEIVVMIKETDIQENVCFSINLERPPVPIITSIKADCEKKITYIAGTSEPQSLVFLSLNNSDYTDMAYTDDAGQWFYEYEGLTGDYALCVQAESSSGNMSGVSDVIHFSIGIFTDGILSK